MRLLSILSCLFVAALPSCHWFDGKKDDPAPTSLPPITQSGKNTFGCYVNGELMVAVNRCRKLFCAPNPKYDPSLGITVGGQMDQEDNPYPLFAITISLDNVKDEGVYSLDTIARYYQGHVQNGILINKMGINKQYEYSAYTYDSTSYCRGELKVTKWDKSATGFIAGTFWFDLYNPKQYPDTIRVRDGRFDIAAP